MNRTLWIFMISTLLLCYKVTAQEQPKFHLDNTKQVLAEEIERIIKQTGIPSISLSLIKKDSIVWSRAFGVTNVKKKVPATPSTIYSTGSNFKFVTAAAIMQLAESGKLDLDDPVNRYLRESTIDDLAREGAPVTFRHLLSHHAGLKASIELIPLWDRKLPKTLEEVAADVTAEELPGVNYQYCNPCYALLGLAIEKISGQSYQNYIVENILEPLQIKSKGPVIPTPQMVEELALPYFIENNQPVPEYQTRFDVYPAGDIYLTSHEMAKFLVAQLNGGSYNGRRILKESSIKKMQEPQFGSTYGLGTKVIKNGNKKFLQHEGAVPGFSTFYKVDVISGTGVYLASNAGDVQHILVEIGNFSLKLLNEKKHFEPSTSSGK